MAMTGAPTTPRHSHSLQSPNISSDAISTSCLVPFFPSENDGKLANMTTPEGPPLEDLSSPAAKSMGAAPEGDSQGPSDQKGKGTGRKARSSSSSVVSLMSEDGEVDEGTPTLGRETVGASRPRRAAAARSRRATSEATAAAATPPAVPAKYREELQKVDGDIMQIIKNGLPRTDLLSNRDAYLKAKKELNLPVGHEKMEEEGEQPLGTGLVLAVQRLLRLLCEGSLLPLSYLAEAASKALSDGGPDGEAPVFSVEPQTLKVELPVLLTRRR